ncbi:MAG: FkbM family methyltransferase [Candidatus Taylorbacteria bacterium]
MKYYSQYKQDEFLDKNVFKGKTGGFFIEMGADDGITHSNTLFFEKERSWNGICVEPRKEAFGLLRRNRRCYCENVCISDVHGEKAFLSIDGHSSQLSGLLDKFDRRHIERIEKESTQRNTVVVPCILLEDLLNKYGIKNIDYFSLDVEGGELGILKSIDFNKVKIGCISVENNYGNENIRRFLESKKYRFMSQLKIDEIYALKDSAFDSYKEPLSRKSDRFYRKCKSFIKHIIGYEKN